MLCALCGSLRYASGHLLVNARPGSEPSTAAHPADQCWAWWQACNQLIELPSARSGAVQHAVFSDAGHVTNRPWLRQFGSTSVESAASAVLHPTLASQLRTLAACRISFRNLPTFDLSIKRPSTRLTMLLDS